MASEECRSCHREIDWAEKFPFERNEKTGLPKTIPLDHDSVDDPKGNIEVWREDVLPLPGMDAAPVLFARYLKKGEEPTPGHHRGRSHFSTCPQAGQWRSKQ